MQKRQKDGSSIEMTVYQMEAEDCAKEKNESSGWRTLTLTGYQPAKIEVSDNASKKPEDKEDVLRALSRNNRMTVNCTAKGR